MSKPKLLSKGPQDSWPEHKKPDSFTELVWPESEQVKESCRAKKAKRVIPGLGLVFTLQMQKSLVTSTMFSELMGSFCAKSRHDLFLWSPCPSGLFPLLLERSVVFGSCWGGLVSSAWAHRRLRTKRETSEPIKWEE